MTRFSKLLFALTIIAALSSSTAAHAVLGEDLQLPDSGTSQGNANQSVVRKATVSKQDAGLYTVSETEVDGIRIREFASSAGKVFAVSWRGVRQPELSTLLGGYFQEFKTEERKQAPTRARRATVATSKIMVRKAGHMRDIRGTAYVPELVPAGVDVEGLE